MHKLSLQNIIDGLSLISVTYLVITLFLPPTQILLWITILLLIFNYGMALRDLILQGAFSKSLIILNLVQVILFCQLNILIYNVLGHEHYTYTVDPRWYDWIELVAVHILRAVDILDVLSAYNIELQNVKHQSVLAGMVLFSMHIMVDIFIFGKLFSDKPIRVAAQKILIFFSLTIKKIIESFMVLIRHYALFAFLLGMLVFMGIVILYEKINFIHILFWFVENILRTLDIGDAFQIFDWQLYGEEMSLEMATVTVLFRLVASIYTLWLVKYFALILFKGRGRTIEELLDIYSAPESEKDADIALQALGKFDSQAVFSHLAFALADKKWETRHAAADLIFLNKMDLQWRMDNDGSHIIPPLLKALREKNSELIYIRTSAAKLSGKMGHVAKKTYPQLVLALNDNESNVREAAAEALGKIGESADNLIPPLLNTFNDSEPEVRSAAVSALEAIGPEIRKATLPIMQPLVKAFGDESDEVRRASISVLGNIGPKAAKAMSRIVMLLLDNTRDVRHAAEIALEKINPQWQQSEAVRRALPHLVKALTQGEDRHIAAAALGKIGSSAIKAMPYLVKALNDRNINVRTAAAFALGNLGDAAKPAIPYLTKLLEHSDWKIRSAAMMALKKIN